MSGCAFTPWTAEEDAVLFEHYPQRGTDGALPDLPGRTRRAIRKRACKLGISRRYMRNQDPADYEPDNYNYYMRAQTRRFAAALKAAGYA